LCQTVGRASHAARVQAFARYSEEMPSATLRPTPLKPAAAIAPMMRPGGTQASIVSQ
jgi:hypothetical protein